MEMPSLCEFAFIHGMLFAWMLAYLMISISIPITILVESKDDNAKEYIGWDVSTSNNILTSNINKNVRILSSNYMRENMKNPSNYDNMSDALVNTQTDFVEWVRYVASKKHDVHAFDAQLADRHSQGYVDRNASLLKEMGLITVSKTNKEADFTSIQEAVNSIPYHNTRRVTIQIDKGIYEEKVAIPASKPYVTLWGAGSDATIITWHDTASSSESTFKSASVAVNSKYFIARDVSFKNSAPAPPPGAKGKQAVALRISGDKAAFYNCKFYGAQDTLYDQAGRHYFQSCFIEGSIDFIFGDGLSLYERCQLHSIATTFGSLTAQNRKKPSENTGFSFVDCKVTGSGMIYLGRAWGPYSRVVFITTYIDDIIIPTGWDDWGDSSNQKTAFYGEYNCLGAGSNSKSRVAWSYQLSASQASPFQSLSFVDGSSWVQS